MIALVDDDEGVRAATSRLLRSLGHRVGVFASAQEFLNSDHLSSTACLLTDVQMPGMSGIELHERLKASGHTFPVIVITAFPDERVRERAIQLGATSFLTKPYKEADLKDCIDRALGQPSG